MKLQIDRAALLPFAQRAAKIAGTKSPAQILSGVLLRTGEGLSLASGDIITGYQASVTASVTKPGSIVVSAKAFADAVDTMPAGTIDISANAACKLTMKHGKRVISLNGQNGGEYPTAPVVPRSWTSVDSKTLVDLIRRVLHAVGPESKGAPFTGVNITVKDGRLRAAALDGVRISVAQSKDTVDAEIDVLMPGPFAKLLPTLLGEGPVKIGVMAPNVFAAYGTEVVYGKLYEQPFINIDEWMPRWVVQTRQVRVNKAALLDALGAMSRVADIDAVHIVAANEQLLMSGSNPKNGAVEDTVMAAIEGDPTTAKSMIKFLTDAVSVIEGDEVRIDMGNDMCPLVVRPADGNDSQLDVVMTMDPSMGPPPPPPTSKDT